MHGHAGRLTKKAVKSPVIVCKQVSFTEFDGRAWWYESQRSQLATMSFSNPSPENDSKGSSKDLLTL